MTGRGRVTGSRQGREKKGRREEAGKLATCRALGGRGGDLDQPDPALPDHSRTDEDEMRDARCRFLPFRIFIFTFFFFFFSFSFLLILILYIILILWYAVVYNMD